LIVTDILSRTVYEVIADCCLNLDTLPFTVPFGGLGSTYTIHLRLIGKRVVDFLVVLIELFAGCYGWGVTGENGLKIGVVQGVGQYSPNFRVEEDDPTNHLYTDK